MQIPVKAIKVDYSLFKSGDVLTNAIGFYNEYEAAQHGLKYFGGNFFIHKRTEYSDGSYASTLIYDSNGVLPHSEPKFREVCGIKVYEGKS